MKYNLNDFYDYEEDPEPLPYTEEERADLEIDMQQQEADENTDHIQQYDPVPPEEWPILYWETVLENIDLINAWAWAGTLHESSDLAASVRVVDYWLSEMRVWLEMRKEGERENGR